MPHAISERIEILVAMNERKKNASALNIAKWSVEDWTLKLNIPRATLYGHIEAEEELFSSDADPDSKRATIPGNPAPTKKLEVSVAQLVRQRYQEDYKITKKDIIEHSVRSIAVEAAKTPKARRFIRLNRLVRYIALYPKQSTHIEIFSCNRDYETQDTIEVCDDHKHTAIANLCATKSEVVETSLDTLDDTKKKDGQLFGSQQCPILIDSDGDDDCLNGKVVANGNLDLLHQTAGWARYSQVTVQDLGVAPCHWHSPHIPSRISPHRHTYPTSKTPNSASQRSS